MVDLGSITSALPSWQSLTSGGNKLLTYGLVFIVGILVLGGLGVLAWILWSNSKFNRKIIIFEKINGRWEQTGRDRATAMSFSKAGDQVLFLKKRKKYLPLPELQMGRRTYWYAIREDGEWINVSMEDIDLAMKQAKAKFLHTEMRAFRTAIQRNLKDSFKQDTFMQKYGHIILPIITIVICGLLLYFIGQAVVSGIDKNNANLGLAKEVADKQLQILSGLDKVCSHTGVTTP